jgi:hypothetical protein
MKGTSARAITWPLVHCFRNGRPPNRRPQIAESGGRCDSASQASCDYPQFRSGVRVFEKFAYVRSPNVQRLFTFREELVPLIYGRDP